jgi:hypothetical protein
MIEQEPTSQAPDSQSAVTLQVKKRPWSVTLLAGIVLIITIINLIRFVLSLRYWTFLSSLSAVSPVYLAITGLVWSMAGVAVVWGLWTAKPWGPRLMQAVGLSYALYYWLDLVFLKEHPINGAAGTMRALLPTNWQLSAAVTLVLLAFMVWVLGRPKVKAYFTVVSSTD